MYALADKPIRLLHFHPLGRARPNNPLMGFDFFNGENQLKIVFMPPSLLQIFRDEKSFNLHR